MECHTIFIIEGFFYKSFPTWCMDEENIIFGHNGSFYTTFFFMFLSVVIWCGESVMLCVEMRSNHRRMQDLVVCEGKGRDADNLENS